MRSDLPAGAGLSSSAALEVAVALALCAVAEFELEPFELALACQRAELRAVGVPCGILDQAASLLGRDGRGDPARLRHARVPARAGARRRGARRRRLGGSHSHESSARRPASGAEHALSWRRRELEAGDAAQRRRATSSPRTVACVEFAAALERDDLAAAGALLLASHASLRDDYEVSIPELDLLVELA